MVTDHQISVDHLYRPPAGFIIERDGDHCNLFKNIVNPLSQFRDSAGSDAVYETESILQQLNSIEQQLNANMTQRKMLLNQYNKQLSGFNMQPRKTASVRR